MGSLQLKRLLASNFSSLKERDELAQKILSILPSEVQIATSTFHKYWIDCWQFFVESSECEDIFTTMVSQLVRAFGITIEAEALTKNFQNKIKVSQAEPLRWRS